MNERTNTPFKALFSRCRSSSYHPGHSFHRRVDLLGSPKIGIHQPRAASWFGLEKPLFNVYSLWGMIWVDGLHYSPMAFLLMTAAFRAMDPRRGVRDHERGDIFQVAWN